jgi:hypothetical protein
MSTRGTDFLDKWISNPKRLGVDVISVAELTQKLFADAKALGIGSVEIEGSVYEDRQWPGPNLPSSRLRSSASLRQLRRCTYGVGQQA